MSLPVTVPFTFGNATTTQSLSSLDTNFTTITNSVNGLTNGASQINVASITATGTANASTFLRGDGAWIVISGSGTVTSVDVNGGTTGLTTSGGPVTGSGNITIAGTLVVANGGTGAANLTLNSVVLGNNTGTVKVVAPGTSGNVLTSDGTIWLSKALSGGTGTVTSITAGTGLSGGTITTSGTIALVTTLGAVGTYALLRSTSSVTAGSTYAGSGLQYTGSRLINNGCAGVAFLPQQSATASPSGTWQAMGTVVTDAAGSYAATLFIRTA